MPKPTALRILFLLLPTALFSQPQLTPLQAKRLYHAGQLWGNVKFFHPWLHYKPIAWDSAFVAAGPQVLAARSDEEYAAALQRLVGVLGDGATTVSLRSKPPSLPRYTNTNGGSAVMQDSILVVRLNSKAIADDWNETEAVTATASRLLAEAKGVVFDFRITESGSRLAHPGEMSYEFATANSTVPLNVMLAPFPLQLPVERTVLHEGFRSEAKGTDTYNSFFKVGYAAAVSPGRKKPVPVVFLVNSHGSLPGIALVLQRHGLATILSENGSIEACTAATFRYAADSLDVIIRKADLADERGLLQPTADGLLPTQTDYAINLQTAIELARKPVVVAEKVTVPSGSYTGVWKAETYASTRYPDLGSRLLAAAKMYSVIRFFFPNKGLMDKAWDSVYLQYLPQFVAATDSVAYAQAVAAMYAHIQDSHGFAWMAYNTAVLPILGKGGVPSVGLSRLGNTFIVSRSYNDSAAKAEKLEIGDVVLKINGDEPMALLKKIRVYHPASNNEAGDRTLTAGMLFGNEGTSARLTVQKANGKVIETVVSRNSRYRSGFGGGSGSPFRKPMPVCTVLAGNIGYVDLLQLEVTNVDSVMNALRTTKAIVFDDRCYPPSVAQDLFAYLPLPTGPRGGLQQPVADADAVVAGDGDYKKERAIVLRNVLKPTPGKWLYGGKTVVLFNEYTQSFAEGVAHRLMDAGATAVGSHTAGANGDITDFNIPGRINLSFSGRQPVNADGTTPQRVGLQPTIKIEPTAKGVQAGKDEVLERALLYLQTGR